MEATTRPPDLPPLAERLGRVETEQFHLRRVQFAILVCVGAMLLMGQATPNQLFKVVEAEKFVVRDASGKTRSELGLTADGLSLVMVDENGNRRLRLAVLADGTSGLFLYDRGGQERAVLEVNSEGEAQLGRFDKQGKNQALKLTEASTHQSDSGTSTAPQDGVSPMTAAPLFRRLCVTCHGADGRGRQVRSRARLVPDFTDPVWQGSRTNPQLTASILIGRGTRMPAFDDQLNKEQAGQLVAYIRTFAATDANENEAPAAGFESRLRQLQQRWDELEKQLKSIEPSPH